MNPEINKQTIPGVIAKVLIPLIILAAGGVALAYFKTTAPRIKRTPPKLTAAVVDVLTVEMNTVHPLVEAMGTVTPSREVTLRARVSGEIRNLSPDFAPGGHIAKGEAMVELDPADYEVAAQKAQSALEKAQADLAIEKGNQTIAREELRLLSETSSDAVTETDLLLRKPQLQKARAAVSSAEAELRQTRLNLSRTIVRAPFNALVVNRNVNLGSHVSTQDSLATIVSTDTYWVEALIPLDRLGTLDVTRPGGCPATVHSEASGGSWRGTVIRTTGKLSDKSRMAKVIIAVPDPLGLNENSPLPQLILEDYVSVEIQGRPLNSVAALPRTALRDGDTVWIYRDGKLEIRRVVPAWKQDDRVYIRAGLASAEQVVISDLSTPVKGMRLRISGETDKKDNLAMAESHGRRP